jgi:flagellar hook protein FlgE
MQRVFIDIGGILTSIYTNGRHQHLYQIGLTRFINPLGLTKLGDNVYMETRWSGASILLATAAQEPSEPTSLSNPTPIWRTKLCF